MFCDECVFVNQRSFHKSGEMLSVSKCFPPAKVPTS